MFPSLTELTAKATKKGMKMRVTSLNDISTMVEYKAVSGADMKIIYRRKYAYVYKDGKLWIKEEWGHY